jgi:hypothetical protein
MCSTSAFTNELQSAFQLALAFPRLTSMLIGCLLLLLLLLLLQQRLLLLRQPRAMSHLLLLALVLRPQ